MATLPNWTSTIATNAKDELQSEELEIAGSKSSASPSALTMKRREQANLPEAVAADSDSAANFAAGRQGSFDYRINTFESELDPFELSLLDSGHLVLFRNVWRDGRRYIQGQTAGCEPVSH